MRLQHFLVSCIAGILPISLYAADVEVTWGVQVYDPVEANVGDSGKAGYHIILHESCIDPGKHGFRDSFLTAFNRFSVRYNSYFQLAPKYSFRFLDGQF